MMMKQMTAASGRCLVMFFLVLSTQICAGQAQAESRCSQEDYSMNPKLWEMAFNQVANHRLNKAGRAALLKLYRSKVFAKKATLGAVLKHLPDVLTGLEAADAMYAGDYRKVISLGSKFAVEKGLTWAGVPLMGEVMLAVDVTMLSFEELRHQECLKNIDLSYYNFLDDPKMKDFEARLQQTTDVKKRNAIIKEQTRYYLMNYIHGEGRDPFGKRRDINRKYLQCYVDKELPGQNIQVDYSEWNPFARITQALQVSADNPGLRTATHMMLSDFSKRRKIEQARQKMLALRRSKQYSLFKEVLPALAGYPYLEEWICTAYLKLKKQGGPPPETSQNIYTSVQHQQKDWYCTNRPVISMPVKISPFVQSGKRKREQMLRFSDSKP